VKRTVVVALGLVAVTVAANPAPVADLSRSNNQGVSLQASGRTGSVSERLAALERVVDARAAAQIEMQQQLESLLTEVSELRGSTEEHSYKLEQILQQQRDIYQEIDRRLGGAVNAQQSAAPAAQANVPAGNPAAVVAPEEVAATAAPVTTEAEKPAVNLKGLSDQELYNRGVDLISKDKDYAGAISLFENFIVQHPKSNLTPNAHYWLGQLYSRENNVDKAKTHFVSVVSKYPNSSKVPDSLLKLGEISAKQNDVAAAKKYYDRLIRSFPKSKAAGIAKNKLESL